jgi:uncharacterized protein (DUF58 family)
MKRDLPSEIGDLLAGAGLEILARQIVDGFLIGLHHGTRRGTGTEFSQYRSYQPGDDIRLIDWKMFARSDRYYIIESETETSITVRFFLDRSASMAYEENGLKRIDYASLIVAALATLAHRQGDSIGLHIVNTDDVSDLEPRRRKQQLNLVFDLLESVECAGTWPDNSEWIMECTSHQSELWIFCSDMLDEPHTWKAIRELSETFGHELLFLQVLGRQELDLQFDGVTTVRDPETQAERTIRSGAVLDEYRANLREYLHRLDDAVTGRRSERELITMDQPVSDALRSYLEKRSLV